MKTLLLFLVLFVAYSYQEECSDVCGNNTLGCPETSKAECLSASGGQCFWCGTELFLVGVAYQCYPQQGLPCSILKEQTAKTGSCVSLFACSDASTTTESAGTITTGTTTASSEGSSTFSNISQFILLCISLLCLLK